MDRLLATPRPAPPPPGVDWKAVAEAQRDELALARRQLSSCQATLEVNRRSMTRLLAHLDRALQAGPRVGCLSRQESIALAHRVQAAETRARQAEELVVDLRDRLYGPGEILTTPVSL